MSEWRNFLIYLPLDKANWEFKSASNIVAPMLLYYTTPAEKHYLLDRKYGQFWSGLAANKLYQLKTKHELWIDTRSLKLG